MASFSIDDASLPSVNPTGAPANDFQRLDVNPDMFGGSIARGLSSVGQGLEKASSEGFSVLEQQSTMDAHTHAAELHSWQSDQTTNATEKFLGLKGKAAEMARPDFKKQIEDIHKETLSQAGNPFTAQLVNSAGRGLIDRNYALAARHSATEKKTWEAQTASNASKSYQDDAVFYATSSAVPNVSDDPSVMGSLAKSDAEAMNYWESQGYEGEALKGKIQAARGVGVTEIVKALASDESPTGVKRANDFYKQEQNNIDAKSRITIQNTLKSPLAGIHGQEYGREAMGVVTVPQKPMEIASKLVGADEHAQREVLSKFIGRVGGQSVDPTTTPWCAAFVNAVLREAGLQGSGSLAARSFLNYGQVVDDKPKEGDVVILSRGDPSSGLGHVGFYAGPGSAPGSIRILAGNQGNKVSYGEFPQSQVLGVRRITAADVGQTPQIDSQAGRPTVSQGEAQLSIMNNPDLQNRPDVMAKALAHVNKVYGAYKLMDAEDNAIFKRRYQNTIAEIADTGSAKNPLTQEEVSAAFPGRPDKAMQMWNEYQDNAALGATTRAIAGYTPQQVDDVRKKYAPQTGSENYIEQSKKREIVDKAIAQNDQEKQKDPAQFAITRTDEGRANFDQFQKTLDVQGITPEARRNAADIYANSMKALQTQMGIPPEEQRIVPKWYLDDIQKKLSSPETSGGANNIGAQLRGLSQLWGDHWPELYRQIAPDAAPLVRVVGSGISPDAETALINSFKVKEGDLLKNQADPVETMKTVTSAVDTELSPFYRSLSGSKQDQTKTDFRTMATRLATIYLQNNTGMTGEAGFLGPKDVGGSVQESARKAVKDLVNFKYDFRDNYRIPKDSGVGPDVVQAGAAEAKEMLGTGALAIASKRDDVGGLSPEYLSSNTVSSVRRNSLWLTDPQEKGLVLVQGNGMAVRRADGSPLTLTWRQLSDLAVSRSKKAPDVYSGIQP